VDRTRVGRYLGGNSTAQGVGLEDRRFGGAKHAVVKGRPVLAGGVHRLKALEPETCQAAKGRKSEFADLRGGKRHRIRVDRGPERKQ